MVTLSPHHHLNCVTTLNRVIIVFRYTTGKTRLRSHRPPPWLLSRDDVTSRSVTSPEDRGRATSWPAVGDFLGNHTCLTSDSYLNRHCDWWRRRSDDVQRERFSTRRRSRKNSKHAIKHVCSLNSGMQNPWEIKVMEIANFMHACYDMMYDH